MKSFFFNPLSIFMAFGLMVFPAQAAQSLSYADAVPRSSLEKIENFYAQNFADVDVSQLKIAQSDLNNDGLNEFIAHIGPCNQNNPCRFSILAENDERIYALGHINCKNILLGNEYTDGVRNLLVFKNTRNDFDYQLYKWHSETSIYRKSRS